MQIIILLSSIIGLALLSYSIVNYFPIIYPSYTSSPVPEYAEDPYGFLFFTAEDVIQTATSSFLFWIDELARALINQQASAKSEPSCNSKPSAKTRKEKCQRIDRLFEIGLLLVTVLSAQELQYISVKRLGDIDSAFKELTIPIIILILLWLIKELLTPGIPLTTELLPLKRTVKEFCWTLLSNFIVLGILSFLIIGFTADINQLVSSTIIMVAISCIVTFPITWEYKKCEQKDGKFKSKRARRAFFAIMAYIEHTIIYFISYAVLIRIIVISNLPAP